jgi:hypothetical protein
VFIGDFLVTHGHRGGGVACDDLKFADGRAGQRQVSEVNLA